MACDSLNFAPGWQVTMLSPVYQKQIFLCSYLTDLPLLGSLCFEGVPIHPSRSRSLLLRNYSLLGWMVSVSRPSLPMNCQQGSRTFCLQRSHLRVSVFLLCLYRSTILTWRNCTQFLNTLAPKHPLPPPVTAQQAANDIYDFRCNTLDSAWPPAGIRSSYWLRN